MFTRTTKALFAVLLLGFSVTLAAGPTVQADSYEQVRFAQFNVWELSRAKLDQVDAAGQGISPQLKKAAEIIQRVSPDVLLLNEIDYDFSERLNVQRFQERYLGVSQRGQEPLHYPYIYFEAVNTGVPSGYDLDHDGESDGPGDGFGYGRYPGQYGMALLSRYPIIEERARSLQKLLWKEVPGNLIPDGQQERPIWYSPEELEVLPLSSKSHWDVPLLINGETVHMLCAHPTPMGFDGEEDRNGRRNFDEIRLLADYIAGGERAAYIVDDAGQAGGLAEGSLFVVMGDMNNNPGRDPGPYGMAAMSQILSLERVQDPVPAGENRSVDYVLPSVGFNIVGQGVFWPAEGDPLRVLVDKPEPASDHRMTWTDVRMP
jgi:endonuclease/exonuclease/phosphatase family metal-dependent hydrolase